MLNVFESDLFSFTSLTSAVNKLPEKPHELGQWLPWNEQGVNTVSIVVEEKDGSLSVVPSAPRGGGKLAAVKRDPRRARSLLVPHYPHYDSILAAEVQGVRAFGSESQMETVEAKRAEKLAAMQANHEVTWEFARAGAISGVLYDANGDVIYDWHSEFGVSRNSHDIALGTATTNVRDQLIQAKRKSEVELGATLASGYKLICGSAIWSEITSHASVEKAFDRWQDGAYLRADNRRGFMIADDIEVVSYHKSKVGDLEFIAPDEAFLCPIAPIYQARFAPADTLEAANTIGLPLYTMGEPMPFGRGIELCTESNHIHYVERPRAIVRIKKS